MNRPGAPSVVLGATRGQNTSSCVTQVESSVLGGPHEDGIPPHVSSRWCIFRSGVIPTEGQKFVGPRVHSRATLKSGFVRARPPHCRVGLVAKERLGTNRRMGATQDIVLCLLDQVSCSREGSRASNPCHRVTWADSSALGSRPEDRIPTCVSLGRTVVRSGHLPRTEYLLMCRSGEE
jgi:hypothetical protein